MKIMNFRGDLTDISAKREALSTTCIHSTICAQFLQILKHYKSARLHG